MATAKLGFEIYALSTILERADVGDGSGGEREPAQIPSAKGGPPGSFQWARGLLPLACERKVREGERDPGLSRSRFKTNDL